IGEHHRGPIGLRREDTLCAIAEPSKVISIERERGGERLEHRDRAPELGVDTGRQRPSQLEADALGLDPLLLEEKVEPDGRHGGDGDDAGRGEHEEPSAERNRRHRQGVAILSRQYAMTGRAARSWKTFSQGYSGRPSRLAM